MYEEYFTEFHQMLRGGEHGERFPDPERCEGAVVRTVGAHRIGGYLGCRCRGKMFLTNNKGLVGWNAQGVRSLLLKIKRRPLYPEQTDAEYW
jgi:hypothetical protein